ncbi:MAG: hypothetical protein CL920_28895 [Deltaproteobacteria bacterium]|nr:hypothetical protein [Deltaproteobacteria bacterium]MBK04304.1 hypothetical protein [Deltaproteobacteria bacterium]MBU52727.1 hypothetical protein [Deltaproteobacteria bacterium]
MKGIKYIVAFMLGLTSFAWNPPQSHAQQCKSPYTTCVLRCNQNGVKKIQACERILIKNIQSRRLKAQCEKEFDQHNRSCVQGCFQQHCKTPKP